MTMEIQKRFLGQVMDGVEFTRRWRASAGGLTQSASRQDRRQPLLEGAAAAGPARAEKKSTGKQKKDKKEHKDTTPSEERSGGGRSERGTPDSGSGGSANLAPAGLGEPGSAAAGGGRWVHVPT